MVGMPHNVNTRSTFGIFSPRRRMGKFSGYYFVLETFIILQKIDIPYDNNIVQNEV